jgi:para-nitrobenzyl esterase
MAAAPRVEIASGRLEGRRSDGVDVFLGVPYAQPPIGARRFRAPEPAAPWSGVRAADAFGGAAPQNALDVGVLPGMEVGRQDEDCLYLNVYTPAADSGRRPVLFWIHGGAFVLGGGSQLLYDARSLARRADAVVVTINYRLGALGYLDLESRFGGDFAANLGMRDQIAALAWVRDHIERFGGDAGNVTIFGESAGGMSVGTLLGSPAARGLFQRAIPQSGAAHNAHDRETSARVADFFVRALGGGDARALREAPVEQILKAQLQCTLRVGEIGVMLPFQPTFGEAVLPEPPLASVRAGNAAGVDVFVGTTRDEWRLFEFLDPTHRTMDDAGFLARAAGRVGRDAAAQLCDLYRKDAPQAAPADHFSAFETDRVFRVPAVRLADAQSAHATVYGYEFAWPSPGKRARSARATRSSCRSCSARSARPAWPRSRAAAPTPSASRGSSWTRGPRSRARAIRRTRRSRAYRATTARRARRSSSIARRASSWRRAIARCRGGWGCCSAVAEFRLPAGRARTRPGPIDPRLGRTPPRDHRSLTTFPNRAGRPLAGSTSPCAPRRDRARGRRSSARPWLCLRVERVAATCLGRTSL